MQLKSSADYASYRRRQLERSRLERLNIDRSKIEQGRAINNPNTSDVVDQKQDWYQAKRSASAKNVISKPPEKLSQSIQRTVLHTQPIRISPYNSTPQENVKTEAVPSVAPAKTAIDELLEEIATDNINNTDQSVTTVEPQPENSPTPAQPESQLEPATKQEETQQLASEEVTQTSEKVSEPEEHKGPEVFNREFKPPEPTKFEQFKANLGKSWSLLFTKLPNKKLVRVSAGAMMFLLILSLGFLSFAVYKNTGLEEIAAKSDLNSSVAQVLGVNENNESAPKSGIGISEDEPTQSEINNYQVEGNKPRYLSIPSLNINSRIFEVGADSNGDVDITDNIFNVGWYTGSSLPGSGNGAALINGFMEGSSANGALSGLESINKGDQIKIELGDGSSLIYKVDKVESKLLSEINMLEVFRPFDSKKEGLNIISNGDDIDSQTGEQKPRIIVYSTLID